MQTREQAQRRQKGIVDGIKDTVRQLGPDSVFTKKWLTKEDVLFLIDNLFIPFSKILTGFDLYDYQKNIFTSICYYVLQRALPIEERIAATVTVTVARQSGKSLTIGVAVAVLGVLLPLLANLMESEGLKQFRKGFAVGLFGPTFDKSEIVRKYILKSLKSEEARRVLSDPAFGILPGEVDKLDFSNGFQVSLKTANSSAAIEGDTFHFIIVDETQDITMKILRQSIMPMRAATGGSIVCIGTPIDRPCFLSEQIMQNRAKDMKQISLLKTKAERDMMDRIKLHHEYDWTHHARHSPDYKLIVESDKESWGENSDEFRTKYLVEWILDRGTLLTPGRVEACGISDPKDVLEVERYDRRLGKTVKVKFTRPHHPVSHDDFNDDLVFSIDFASSKDYTVVTIAKVFWDNPIAVGDEERYHIHVYEWFQLQKDYEEQYFEIMFNILPKYKGFTAGIVDATGPGDPIYSRMKSVLETERGIDLYGFVMGLQSKHNGYHLLKQEMEAGRVTYPNGETCRKYKKQAEFRKQLSNLVKTFSKNNYMQIHAPDLDGWHDDFADSLMMLVWMVNKERATPVLPVLGSGDASELAYKTGLSDHLRKLKFEHMFGRAGNSFAQPKKSNIFSSRRRRR